eukprot:gene17768-19543_t
MGPPPAMQKSLVKVDKAKTRTVRFKNGVPPKIIRSRDFGESSPRIDSSERLTPAKPSSRLRNVSASSESHEITSDSRKNRTQAQIVNELVLMEKKKGIVPSLNTTSAFGKQEHSKKSPFSPPPTISELKSLTKKIGRFYTVKHSEASSMRNPWRTPQEQRMILDIERALSSKDVNGLEKCYRRIFNGESAPIRTLVKNQFLPNQRSRQASYPLGDDVTGQSPGSATSSLSGTTILPKATQSASHQRRWSIDSLQDKRLPYVPAPYVRSETRSSPAKVYGMRHRSNLGERPVMFSSSNFNQQQQQRKQPRMNGANLAAAPSTAILTLDPGKFPQLSHTNRSQAVCEHSNRKSPASGSFSSGRKQLMCKTSSIWYQRAPNSTPESSLHNGSDNAEAKRPVEAVLSHSSQIYSIKTNIAIHKHPTPTTISSRSSNNVNEQSGGGITSTNDADVAGGDSPMCSTATVTVADVAKQRQQVGDHKDEEISLSADCNDDGRNYHHDDDGVVLTSVHHAKACDNKAIYKLDEPRSLTTDTTTVDCEEGGKEDQQEKRRSTSTTDQDEEAQSTAEISGKIEVAIPIERQENITENPDQREGDTRSRSDRSGAEEEDQGSGRVEKEERTEFRDGDCDPLEEELTEKHAVLKSNDKQPEPHEVIEINSSDTKSSSSMKISEEDVLAVADEEEDNKLVQIGDNSSETNTQMKMDDITIVVVNVTTDEGKDVNADIYEYGCEENSDQGGKTGEFGGKQTEEEKDEISNTVAAKTRKEKLEALLQEHSNIVETVKTLSAEDTEQQ